MNYIGVDLAWKKTGPSALAAWTSKGAALHREIRSADIPEIIHNLSGESACVAVDAPLIISNETGQRPCESKISQRFGKNHASAHSMNLCNPNASHLLDFSRHLQNFGFQLLSPSNSWNSGARWLAEVYPHPAQITLFDNLPKRNKFSVIYKYKKGRVDDKQKGMRKFADGLSATLRRHMPDFADSSVIAELLSEDYSCLRGKNLKSAEDALDACFCVLIAERIMAAGEANKCHYFGDLENGFIVVPSPQV